MSKFPINGNHFKIIENENTTIENTNNNKSEQSMDFSRSRGIFSSSLKHIKIPTPEEFIKLFCQIPTTQPVFNDTFNKIEHHSQLFRVHDIRVTADPLYNSLENDSKFLLSDSIEVPFVKCDHYIQRIPKIGSIYSDCLQFDSFQSNLIKIPKKRKAITEVCIGKKCKLENCFYSLFFTNLYNTNKELLINIKCEFSEDFNNKSEIRFEIIIGVIYSNHILYRCSEFLPKFPFQFTVTAKRYLIKKDELVLSKIIENNQNFTNINLNKPLSIWTTKTTIRFINLIYKKLLSSFMKLSESFGNVFNNYIIQFLCNFINNKNQMIFMRNFENSGLIFLEKNANRKLSDFNRYLFEQFNKNIRKIFSKYRNVLSTSKLFRLIIFVIYLLYHKFNLPENTVKSLKWKTILNLFCKFECRFFKFYNDLELKYFHKMNFIEKVEKLYKEIFTKLLKEKSLKNKRYSYIIYECRCGVIFNTYLQWLKHSNQMKKRRKNELKMIQQQSKIELFKNNNNNKKTPQINSCKVFKCEIYSHFIK